MSRPFRTLNSRVITDPTLRNLSEKGGCSLWSRPQVSCMGFLRDVAASRHSSNEFGSALDFATLLKVSIFDTVEKSVCYYTRAKTI